MHAPPELVFNLVSFARILLAIVIRFTQNCSPFAVAQYA